MSDLSKAVFLSYASQDAEAAKRICDALRAAGVEVWFDQNELVGGDAWDAKIRGQIADCALFVPIISANTQSRREGYFRLEWKLAAQRTHMIADGTPFLLPVVIDSTRDQEALVPAEFKSVQWTRLAADDDAGKFCARVRRVLEGAPLPAGPARAAAPQLHRTRSAWRRYGWALGGALVVLALALNSLLRSERSVAENNVPPSGALPANASEAARLVAQARALTEDALNATRENYQLAEDLVQKALALDASDASSWALATTISGQMIFRNYDSSPRRVELMRSQAERATRLDPQSHEAGLAMVYALTATRDYAEAWSRLQPLLQRAPKDRATLRQAAAVARRSGREREAAEFTARLDALPGGDAIGLFTQAHYLTSLGRVHESDEILDRLLATSPARLVYYEKLDNLGRIWGDPEAAAAFMTKIPARYMTEVSFAELGAWILIALRRGDEALALLEKVPQEYLEEFGAIRPKGLLAGWAHQIAGRPAAAQAEWGKALSLVEARLKANPTDLRVLHLRATLEALLGRKKEALESIKLHMELSGKDAARWTRYHASVFAICGETESAVTIIESRWPTLIADHRNDLCVVLRFDPEFERVRADPRMQRLLAENQAALDRLRGRPSATSASASGKPTDDKSVAVLAFANLSSDKEQEYFSDGISEELLNVLAKVPGLKVSARTSSFHFKGKDTPIAEIAKQLGVAYVVEGSVRKAGDKVRITAQLVKAADGFHVWSETFTRDLKDIFAVQDEIAGLIAKQLSLTLAMRTAGAPAAVDPRAFELYVQAVQSFNLRTKAGSERADALLQRAIELEPNFARAYALRAGNWAVSVEFTEPAAWSYGWRNSPGLLQMQQVARRAIELDPECAEAYAAMGSLLPVWQNQEAISMLRRAVELNPNYATAHHWFGYALLYDGRIDEATQYITRASELDPLSHRIRDLMGRVNHLAGRFSAAHAAALQALQLQPDSGQANLEMGVSLVDLERPEEGLPYLLRAVELQPYQIVRVVQALVRARRLDLVEQLARSPAAKANSQFEFTYHIARGEPDEAFSPGVVDRITSFEDMLFDPFYDTVRQDPRFATIMKELRLTDAYARAQAWRSAHPPEKTGTTK